MYLVVLLLSVVCFVGVADVAVVDDAVVGANKNRLQTHMYIQYNKTNITCVLLLMCLLELWYPCVGVSFVVDCCLFVLIGVAVAAVVDDAVAGTSQNVNYK